ncbi:MAG: Pr6Pr family membrane protein [Oceanospirillaceae bacterium]|jgi:hypothetical protein|nr:Pr6Pr family membrane protein [Oceanospirillaceae bacterium]
MNNQETAQKALVLVAVIAWCGVLLQLYISLSNAVLDGRGVINGLVRYVAYFTILTNIFVALVATAPALFKQSKLGQWFSTPMVMGSAVTAILFVGLAYNILLRHVWHPEGLRLVADYLLHYITPASLVLFWIVFPPRQTLSKLDPIRWAVYPLGYFVYVLIRGLLGDTYPYYFINVSQIGYGQTIVNALALCMVYVILGSLVLALTKYRQAQQL